MKILYITHSCPYPPNKGDRIRSFHLLRHLSSQHNVTLIYPSFSTHDLNQREVLKNYCAEVLAVPHSPFLAKINCLLALLQGRSLTLGYFYSSGLQGSIERGRYDVVVADCSSMAQYVLDFPHPKVVDFVDVDSEKWKTYAQTSSFPVSWLYRLEYQRLRRFEQEIIERSGACLVTSEQERQYLGQSDHVFVAPNGVDLAYFNPDRKDSADVNNTLLFMGAMNYFPNIDGVEYFIREIFPLIKQQIPTAKFVIAGMHPAKRVQRLAGSDVIVTGSVPDMRPYLNEATVSVVPLRIARGIQNKILEAMAMKVPVVATSVSNAGIHAQEGVEILLADAPELFAKAVVKLLREPHLRECLAMKARQLVENRFSWEHSLQQLDVAIGRAQAGHGKAKDLCS